MLLRTAILNTTYEAWGKINKIEVDGHIDVTPESFADIVMFSGALTAMMTDEEDKFFDEYYAVCKSRSKS
jgi:hypothetical protein